MNRTQARADVRSRLADPSVGGLYTDAQITSALARAHAELAPRFPLDRVSTVSVAAGATSIPAPATGSTVYEITGADGLEVPYDPEAPISTTAPLTWRTVAGDVQLGRAVGTGEAGSWQLRYLVDPADPADDTTAYALPAGMLPALVALACAGLIRQRITEDSRRGHRVSLITDRLARSFEEEADRITRAHFRRARSGVVR